MTLAVLRASTLTLAVCVLAACSGKSTNLKPAELVTIESIQAATVRWSANAGDSSLRDAVRLSPFVTDEFLYTVDVKGKVSAFSAATGDLSWSTELDKNVTAGVNSMWQQPTVRCLQSVSHTAARYGRVWCRQK